MRDSLYRNIPCRFTTEARKTRKPHPFAFLRLFRVFRVSAVKGREGGE
jgi:hypothetical protein